MLSLIHTFISLFAFLPFLTTAIPVDSTPPSPTPPAQPITTYIPPSIPHKHPVTKIFASDGNGFENLHFRPNGHILATTAFPHALLFDVDPIHRRGVLVHNFTSMTSTGGITELAPDVFYVLGKTATESGYSVFEVDMRPFAVSRDGSGIRVPPVIKEAGRVREGLVLNGMTQLSRRDGFVLISDTLVGGVWKFYVGTGEYELVVQDESMEGPKGEKDFAAFGINGIRARGGEVFYCNSGRQTFWKMPLHQNATSAGPASLITSNIACDDFALDPHRDVAYIASPRNAIIKLDLHTGKQLVVAGKFNQSSSNIQSASSAQLGVDKGGRSSVYFTTNGGAFVGAKKGSQGIGRVDVGW